MSVTGFHQRGFDPFRLTPREVQVLWLRKQGLTNREIAQELGVSLNFVENSMTVIREKTAAACVR